MKFFLTVSCLVVCAYAVPYTDFMWEDWKSQHAKDYNSNEDESYRRFVWEENLKFVNKHNAEFANGVHSFMVGMNQFADLDVHEFSKMFLRPLVRDRSMCKTMFGDYVAKMGHPPKTRDWRQKGAVTAVKDQGQCGSCWSFSTTGSLEGAYYLNTSKLVSLSEQNLMDCSRPEGDFSCEGGLMDYAFDYIIINHGVDTEQSYPYEAKDENVCKFKKQNVGATMTSCSDVPKGEERSLHKAVGIVGPVSVAIDASHQSFQLYKSGVYTEPQCSSAQLDHGVLAIGYGSEDGTDYWLVKNSWGTVWGESGYIKMSRNNNNNCGIATSASFPIV